VPTIVLKKFELGIGFTGARAMKRIAAIYAVVTAIFIVGASWIFYVGQNHFGASAAAAALPVGSQSVWSALMENFADPLTRLLVQFIVILVATRLVGVLFTRMGQPAVIGEILAGILLGPSLLGWAAPNVFGFVFAASSLGTVQLFSQIGVCVFMFVIGLELDVANLRRRAQTAIVVSHTSIMVPFLLGAGSALLLYPTFSSGKTSFVSFALFMSIAMSITAFPVLARILTDKGLTRTPLGAAAITCAAVGDATAWAILAVVVAIARATGLIPTLVNLGVLAFYIAAMLFGVRPFLSRVLTVERLRGAHAPFMVAVILIIMAASALFTQAIGIHALFGAFLAGVVMPRDKDFHEYLSVRLENFSTLFLLPLFFAFSGLRTQVNLLNDPSSWLVVLGIVAVAVTGKLVGSMIPARLAGMNWNEAFQLGALMNTRGLVELIALNLGYDLGILPPRIFSMLVLMALITTFMTGPLLGLANWFERRGAGLAAPAH
jgi:Kef-type K+ transport system membrane component KefB